MSLVYYRIPNEVLLKNRRLAAAHEADPLGPRARHYYSEGEADYDYEGAQRTAQQLDAQGLANQTARLELIEPESQAMALLDIEIAQERRSVYQPAMFLCSADSAQVRLHVAAARKRLSPDIDAAVEAIALEEGDHRTSGYLAKQLRHLRTALGKVWRFYEAAESAGEAVLLVDLRARDVFIPDLVELAPHSH
jgi:hypothetical protein